MQEVLNKSPLFTFSVAFLLFRYTVQAPARGSPNISDVFIEMYGAGAQKGGDGSPDVTPHCNQAPTLHLLLLK